MCAAGMKKQHLSDTECPTQAGSALTNKSDQVVDIHVQPSWDQDHASSIADRDSLCKTVASLASSVATHHQEWKKSSKRYDNTSDWAGGQQFNFEESSEALTTSHLKAEGYYDFDNVAPKHCRLPFHVKDGKKVNSVQWDAVIRCWFNNQKYTFVVEAKKPSNNRSVLTMPERVESTMSFIQYCASPSCIPGVRTIDSDRCHIWGQMANSTVRAVIVAEVIPLSVIKMVKKHRMIRISLSQSAWTVVDEDHAENEGSEGDEVGEGV